MSVHLKPSEIIDAIEAKSLSGKAAAHLEQCARCRETLQDTRLALKAAQRDHDSEALPDESFWSDFTQAVHAAIQQPPRAGRPFIAKLSPIAALIFVVMSVLFLTVETHNGPRRSASGPAEEVSDASQPTRSEAAGLREDMEVIGFELWDTDKSLLTGARVYDQLQRELSFVQLSPDTLIDN